MAFGKKARLPTQRFQTKEGDGVVVGIMRGASEYPTGRDRARIRVKSRVRLQSLRPPIEPEELNVITLRNLKAGDVKQALEQLLNGQPSIVLGGTHRPVPPVATFRIVAVASSNSIIVRGDRNSLDVIRVLIAKLQSDAEANTTQTKKLAKPNAPPKDIPPAWEDPKTGTRRWTKVRHSKKQHNGVRISGPDSR